MRYLKYLSLFSMLLLALTGEAQIITTEPPLPRADEAVTIYYDATQGSGGLKGYTGDVYAHTGVLTGESSGGSDWKYVKSGWGENTPETKLTRISEDYYSMEIGPSLREYYGVPNGTEITHMAFVFRSADSELEGKGDGNSDIYVEVFTGGLDVSIIEPNQYRVVDPGHVLTFLAAASMEADLSLQLNAEEVESLTGESIDYSFTFDSSGDYWIRIFAYADGQTAADSVFIHVKGEEQTAPLPEGVNEGINYLDKQTAVLVLYAPLKEDVYLIGDFNKWIPNTASRMIRDGDHFWFYLDDLNPGEEYGYQYLVEGKLRIADPYTEKTLDPNDKWIDEATYPGLKPYPSGLTTGITSVLQTAQEAYDWGPTSFTAPPQEDLVIYELLVRDFLAAHDWKTLTDTLSYLDGLGINAIELMPFNEFEGNESWGYNPSFYFAVDKYYGPARDLKVFIDSCHERGLAVIMDMVLNHSYGQSPLVQMYFDLGKVSPDNPWYNVESPNPVFSWGYDFDHESPHTQDFVDRVNAFWLDSFKVDGFRFDFTKGFTNTPGDGWAYDASRIAILKRMADVIWDKKPDAYVILEHLTENSEEIELSDYGMMLWGNTNYNYNEASMGWHENGKSDFSWISYQKRQWEKPHLVGYMESHDEERLMFKNLEFGNSSGAYNIRDLETALARMELAGTFFFPIPGPKMIWQFGELGYEVSIDDGCRICNKPIRWNYYDQPARRQVYELWADLIQLKSSEPVFSSSDFNLDVRGAVKHITLSDPGMEVRIVGNFGVESQIVEVRFDRQGTWYDFFSGDSIQVRQPEEKFLLQAGQFHLFTSLPVFAPEVHKEGPLLLRESESLVLFPNPATNTLKLDILPVESTLTFTGVDGRIHLKYRLQAWQDSIDITTLGKGLYVVKRSTEGKDPEFGKILKL